MSLLLSLFPFSPCQKENTQDLAVEQVQTCSYLLPQSYKAKPMKTDLFRPSALSICHLISVFPFREKLLVHSMVVSPLLPSPSTGSISSLSVSYSQLWSEHTEWKIPEINGSHCFNYVFFWVLWWNLPSPAPSHLELESSFPQNIQSLHQLVASRLSDQQWWYCNACLQLTLRKEKQNLLRLLRSRVKTNLPVKLWGRKKKFHIHITFIMIYCYNCSFLLSVAVDFLLLLISICKLDFIIDLYT